ncbi:MAG: hypothetical protein ACR2GW_13285 [Pyrinomonadaceae bacterium]
MSLSKRFFERQPTPAERLEQARRRVRFALSEVASDSAPDCETLDEIAQALVLALREMEALQITVAVMQRQEGMMSQ